MYPNTTYVAVTQTLILQLNVRCDYTAARCPWY